MSSGSVFLALLILKNARNLVSNGWCRGSYAVDEQGARVTAYGPHARSYCMQGAVNRACFELMGDASNRNSVTLILALEELRETVGSQLTVFNDNSMKNEVLEAFDVTICRLEQEIV